MRLLASLLFLGVFLGGCPSAPHGSLEAATRMQKDPVDDAIWFTAYARCDREQRCGAVGPGKPYGSFDGCSDELAIEQRALLRGVECPRATLAAPLEACARAMRLRACEAPFTATVPGCEPGAWCVQ
jgi:hypothetical protein